jgi:hypothetical protein
MNERILELAEQCYQIEDPHGQFPREVFNQEKFAELIVWECIDIIDMTHGSKKLMRPDPYQKIIWAIEEHFGVER